MTLPSRFVERTVAALGEQGRALCRALDTPAQVTSVRFNPYKTAERPEGDGVAWNRYGFYLDSRPQFTLDPAFWSGVYYVQEASSMFVEHLYRSAVGERQGVRVLDLCAAPGGKTTLYASLAGLDGLVVANEVVRSRASVLADNVRKWGLGNVAVTCNDPARLAEYREWFDVVAVDAPCSGEGMFRKAPESRGEWSEQGVMQCAARQHRILETIWPALKPGGVLIYSTCTFNREENERVLEDFVAGVEFDPVEIACPESWGVVRGEVNGVNTFRFYPGRIRGEGFFAAVLRKGGDRVHGKVPKARRELFAPLSRVEIAEAERWVAQPGQMTFSRIGDSVYGFYAGQAAAVKALAGSLAVIHSGVCMGQLFKGRLRPDQSLALFHDLRHDAAAETELDEQEAIAYLRHAECAPAGRFAEGLNLVCHRGMPLGWAKRIGGRINNMLPPGWRIVKG